MKLRVDKAGRVVLPKPVRDRLGLQAGGDIEMEETSEGVVLKPIARTPSLVQKGSFLVHTGEVPPGYDITRAIDADREERIREQGSVRRQGLPFGIAAADPIAPPGDQWWQP